MAISSRLKRSVAAAVVAIGLVSGFEGLRTYAYRDPVGIPTICFGETRGVKMGDHKTEAECKTLLGDRLIEHEAGMRKCLKDPDGIPINPYIAALSLTYNIGQGAFCGSTVRKQLDARNWRAACDAFLAWDKARVAGVLVRLPGLTKRRQAERALCLKGVVTFVMPANDNGWSTNWRAAA
jgi:lysozyme